MRKVAIYYKDVFDHYRDEYMAGPYPGTDAEQVRRNLELMGCKDFRVVPYSERKSA